MSTYKVTYEFEFQNREKLIYPLTLDKETVSFLLNPQGPFPSWTKLEHYQCTVCPLTKDRVAHCPIAVNIADLVEHFKEVKSTEYVRIIVYTAERTFMKEAPVQKGLSSIFGIIMATSNCPIMNFLKPMARFHLPFSTDEETIVRSVSMYLLSQYFIAKKKSQPDLSLKQLDRAYSMVQKVNRGICYRISSVVRENRNQGDAASNAIIILDTLSQLLKAEIEENLDSFAALFEGISFFDSFTDPQET